MIRYGNKLHVVQPLNTRELISAFAGLRVVSSGGSLIFSARPCVDFANRGVCDWDPCTNPWVYEG